MATSKILKYSEEAMVNALKAVAEGSSYREAARTFEVPKTTLLYKYTGKYPLKRQMGPSTILTTAEEQQLANWVIHCADNGFPVTKLQLIDSVEMLLKELKRETIFSNNRPGRAWYDRFIERNQLAERMSQNLVKARSLVSENALRDWFGEVEDYLKSQNALDVLNDPTRIYNMDETAFFMSPKENKVLVDKGRRAVYSFVSNNEKECITVLLGSNAAGFLIPPMVVFSYIRLPPRIAYSVPKGWGIGKSESGWMTGEVFFEYIANVFHPWLVKNKIKLPVVLFVDGHTSHLTMALSNFCKMNGILLFSLYPNATHIYQPMDIGLFHNLKFDWKSVVHNFRMDNEGKKIQQEDFCTLLLDVLKKIDSSVLRNSFEASGLYPFNPDAINYSAAIKNTKKSTPSMQPEMRYTSQGFSTMECQKHLTFIEKFIDCDTLSKFKSCGDTWNGTADNENLFKFWYDIFKLSTGSNSLTHDHNTVIAVCNSDNEIIVNENEQLEDLVLDWNFNDEENEFGNTKPRLSFEDEIGNDHLPSSSVRDTDPLVSSTDYRSSEPSTTLVADLCSSIITPVTLSAPMTEPCTSLITSNYERSSTKSNSTSTCASSITPSTLTAPIIEPCTYLLTTDSNSTKSYCASNENDEQFRRKRIEIPSFYDTKNKKRTKRVSSQLDEYFKYFQEKQEMNKLMNDEMLVRKKRRVDKNKEKEISFPAYSAMSIEGVNCDSEDQILFNPETSFIQESIETAAVTEIVNESGTLTVAVQNNKGIDGATVASTVTSNNNDQDQRIISADTTMAFRKRIDVPSFHDTTKKKISERISSQSDEYFEYFQKKQELKKLTNDEKLVRKRLSEDRNKEKEIFFPAYFGMSTERLNSDDEDQISLAHETPQIQESIETPAITEIVNQSVTPIVAVQDEQRIGEAAAASTAASNDNDQDKRNIPPNMTAFQKVLFWPNIRQQNVKKKNPKVKVPCAVVSDKWVNHFKDIENKKEKAEKEKLQRIEDREKKKKDLEEEKLRLNELKLRRKEEQDKKKKELLAEKLRSKEDRAAKKQIMCASKSLKKKKNIESAEINDERIFAENCFVILKYEDEYLPGIIKELKGGRFYTSVMVLAGLERWKWPRIPDIMWYNESHIIEKINEPIRNERGLFVVPEMFKYLTELQ